MKKCDIERLEQLIRMKATGSPEELAKKLNLSKRQVFNRINYLKEEFNAPIKYDKSRKCYFYYCPGRIIQKWLTKKIVGCNFYCTIRF